MKILILIFSISFLYTFNLFSQKVEIPEGYLLQYSQGFQSVNLPVEFVSYFKKTQEKIITEKSNKFLRFYISDTVDLKPTLYLLDNFIFGDFVFEFNTRIKNISKDKCPEIGVILSFKDTLNYYSLNFIIKNNDSLIIKLIANDRGKSILKYNGVVFIKLKEWNDIVVTRELINRTIKVYVNHRNIPVFTINDWSLVMGHVGFNFKNGIFDIDNIKIWSQTFIENKLSIEKSNKLIK